LSAFAVIYERSDAPVDPGVLERVMERLNQRGPDGRDVCLLEHAALGHWHFWTTQEEAGERQPVGLKGMPFKIVLDGRVDNRAELISGLNINVLEGRRLSDAALVLHAYEKWGKDCLEHFIGEYALAILDTRRGELLCARDALGDRTLFYSCKGTRLVVASEAWAVAGADDSPEEINEKAVAYYFAMEATEDGQTLFENVYELLPAHAMLVISTGQHFWRYWQQDPSIRLRGKSDEEYAEGFRGLLEQSVRCRMRATSQVGVLMSGGLDSTSVACLAARMLQPQPLKTISYVFNELADCDERQYINAVQVRWGIRSIQIPCDDAWPLKDWSHWPQNPNMPEGNPYRLLKDRAYDRAKSEGVQVLLTGGFGDHLYGAESDWLADYVTEGRLLKAGKELSLYFRYAGLRWTSKAGFIQRLAVRIRDHIPGRKQIHRRSTLPAWLTAYSTGYLPRNNKEYDRMIAKYGELLDLRAAMSSSGEIFHASRHSLELRHPYRDRRLVEYVLALPAYQLYYRGLPKYILRMAMQDTLPDSIRTRIQPTNMASLFSRGIEREKNVMENCLQDPATAWRKFVNHDWLVKHWDIPATPDRDGPDLLVPWLCISYEKWRHTIVL
jgi:asparagine synthase (glutamine-hydrolysing)